MRGSLRVAVAILTFSGCLPIPAQAYQQQLTTEAIREAYFLGSRNDEITLEFWNHYERIFPASSPYLHVGAVEVLTPYAQVVFAAQHYMTNENAVDAVQKYAGRTLPFIVRVTIDYPANSLPDAYDIEAQSHLVVSQNRRLKPRKTAWHPVYVGTGKYRSVGGMQVEQQFDAAQVSSADLRIRVTFPDGRHFEASFDLRRLQ